MKFKTKLSKEELEGYLKFQKEHPYSKHSYTVVAKHVYEVLKDHIPNIRTKEDISSLLAFGYALNHELEAAKEKFANQLIRDNYE